MLQILLAGPAATPESELRNIAARVLHLVVLSLIAVLMAILHQIFGVRLT